MEKFEFYLAMNGNFASDTEKFQESLTAAYVNGIEPIEYCEDTVTDEDNKVVHEIILLKCRERWRGAAKRFFRKAEMVDSGMKKNNLHVFR